MMILDFTMTYSDLNIEIISILLMLSEKDDNYNSQVSKFYYDEWKQRRSAHSQT